MVDGLTDEEAAIVALVREFVDREVRPVVRDLEHANTYPEKLIGQMKELGIFGLAIPEPWGEAAGVRAVLRRGHRGARARLDEPRRRDGRAHRRRQAARHLRHQAAAGPLPAEDGDRRDPRHDGADRARRRLRPAGDAHRGPAGRRRLRRQRRRRPGSPTRAARRLVALLCKTDPGARTGAQGHVDPAGRARPRVHRQPRPAQARLQGRRELRAGLRRLPGAASTRCSAAPRARGSRR